MNAAVKFLKGCHEKRDGWNQNGLNAGYGRDLRNPSKHTLQFPQMRKIRLRGGYCQVSQLTGNKQLGLECRSLAIPKYGHQSGRKLYLEEWWSL